MNDQMLWDTRKGKRYISAVYRYAFSRLVLHYTLYYQSTREALAISEKEQAVEKSFNHILGRFLQKDADVRELDQMRRQIIDHIEVLTAYSDCFQIYEYVLNRVERRFVKMKNSRYTPEEMAKELVELMAGMEQAADRNDCLRNIISHLPVRFTRQKFYSMITERFSIYTELSRDSVEDFLYMLKTSAMVHLPDNMEQEEELHQVLTKLKHTDYRRLDQNHFDDINRSFSAGVRILTEKTDFYVMIQEMVNELYMLLLTEEGKFVEAGEEQSFRGGLDKLHGALAADAAVSDEEIDEILVQMEGIQESVENIVMAGAPGSDQISKKLEKLASGSHFMPLKDKETSDKTADKAWIEQQARELCQELDELFADMPKAVIRAVMAKVLSSLPVLFRDSIEVKEYIRASLESCTDQAELEACLELLEQELIE